MADLDREDMEELCGEVIDMMAISMDKVIEKGIPKKIAKFIKDTYMALLDQGFTSEQATGIVEHMASSGTGLNMKQS